MPDCYYTTYSIGGLTTQKQREKIADILSANYGVNYGGRSSNFIAAMEESINRGLVLVESFEEVAWGRIEELELFLENHHIAYSKHVSGNCEYSAEVVLFDGVNTYQSEASEDGIPMVCVDAVRKALANNSLEALLFKADVAAGDPPALYDVSKGNPTASASRRTMKNWRRQLCKAA